MNMKKINICKAVLAFVVVLALVLPGSASFANQVTVNENISSSDIDNTIITDSDRMDLQTLDDPDGSPESLSVDWWPMARHDLENTGFSTSTAPGTNNVLWSTTLDSHMEFTEPAVIDGRVFIPTTDIFYCLDASDGSEIWNYTTGDRVVSSPAVVDDNVFFGTEDGVVYCLDALDGSLVWSHMTSNRIYFSSPAVVDGMVFIGAGSPGSIVYCLDASDGSEIWSYTTSGSVYSSPAVVDGKVFIGSYDGNIYCLNASDGLFIWSYAASASLFSGLVVVNSKIFFGTESGVENGIVYCLNMDGSFNWSYSTGDYILREPAVVDGRVFVSVEGYFSVEGATVFCLNESDGSFIWSNAIGGLMYTSPSVADGKVYIGSETGSTDFFCLDVMDGSEIWSYTTGSGVRSSAAIADGKVFVGSYTYSQGTIYCFGTSPGHDVTLASIDSPVTGPLGIITPEVSVTNTGSYDETNVPVNLQITNIRTGNVEYNEIEIISSLNSEETKSVVFPSWIPEDLGISGSITYTVTACTQLAIDAYPENDNVTKMIGLYADIDWWPTFHHDSENTGFSTSIGPETNNLLWKYDESGSGSHSSVVVAEGKAFIGSDNPAMFTCLDAYAGSFIWNFQMPPNGGDPESTAAVADGKVYFTTDDGLYCLYASNGSYIWHNNNANSRGAITIIDGKLYTGGACLNAMDGSLIWKSVSTSGYNAPAVVNGKVYIVGGNFIYCLDATDGSEIWSYPFDETVVDSFPAVADGKVYIGSEDYNVYCLNAENGSLIWSYATLGEVRSSPAVFDGKVFVGSGDYNLYCLNGSDGSFIWSYQCNHQIMMSSPAISSDGKIYVCSIDGFLQCVDITDGSKIWTYDLYHGGASPAIVDGKVYVGAAGTLFCFGPLEHDLKMMSIDSPVTGLAGNFTPEVTVKNVGIYNETDVLVNLQIEKIITTWTEFVYDGDGNWEQKDYAIGGYAGGPSGGTGEYFAIASSIDHTTDVFDVGLFTSPLDLSGLSSVTLDFEMRFSKWATDVAKVNVYSGGSFENLATYTESTEGHESLTFDPSGYVNPSEVYIEFYYSSGGELYQDFFAIDDVSIAAVGFSEGFEGVIFPPVNVVPEYNETVNIDINSREIKSVTFPDWTPVVYGSIDYLVTVYHQLIGDEDTVNDRIGKIITLTELGTEPPEFRELTLTPSDPLDTDPEFGWEYISCNVTDDVAVVAVQLNVTYPDTHTEIIPMELDSGDTYYCNITLEAEGCYAYHVWANDTDDNQNTSESQQFELPPNEDVDMNGQIHFMDLVAIVLMYGEYGPYDGWVREDVDNNGQAHFMDLVAIVLRYGEYWDQC